MFVPTLIYIYKFSLICARIFSDMASPAASSAALFTRTPLDSLADASLTRPPTLVRALWAFKEFIFVFMIISDTAFV